jgi:predicted TIM-barrel fold metal-dependent hydrolase
MRKIATEEAWSIPEVAAALGEVARGPSSSLDKLLIAAIYDPASKGSGYAMLNFLDGLLDTEGQRLKEKDEYGVDMHLLSLTAPGVQMFDADTATDLAALANDRMAQDIGRAPKTQLSMKEYLLRNFVITTSGVEDPLALDYAIKCVGIDNVLWAIDYPYQPMKPAVQFMDSAPVTERQRHQLYHENAERIFHIAPR